MEVYQARLMTDALPLSSRLPHDFERLLHSELYDDKDVASP